MKHMASVMMEEAIKMERELGIGKCPAPRKGLSDKHLSNVRMKREMRIRKLQKSPKKLTSQSPASVSRIYGIRSSPVGAYDVQ